MAEQTYISIVKSMKWSSLTIVLSATLGILLLFLSYCLPTKTISANVAESIGVFQNEGVYPLITGWGLPPLDNFTDARMLETAIYESGKDPLENALMGYSRRVDGTNPVDSLILLCGDNNSAEIYSVSVGDYARYWQGYLVPIKIGLSFFNFFQLREFNSILMSGTVLTLAGIMIKKKLARLVIPFICSFLLMSPLALFQSIQYSTATYPTLAGMIILCLFKKCVRVDNPTFICKTLFIIGIVVNYFDLLTFPLISCGYLLVVCVAICLEQPVTTTRLIKIILFAAISWVVGYGSMWVMKWIVAALFMQDFNIILTAIAQVSVRSLNAPINSQSVADFSYGDVLLHNMEYLVSIPFIWTVIGITIIGSIFLIINYKKVSSNEVYPYLPVVLLPFIWYVALGNHSIMHAFFTYRILTISVFAVLTVLSSCLVDLVNKKPEVKKRSYKM